ncbi:hypothetical protein KIH76_05530 [Bifidobacterium sp. 81T8]|nr:DUF6625 family protein [Bifidobacterium simiiventris]MBW3078678.1 hypothetical protein [Bifidobacterium simiiventris]
MTFDQFKCLASAKFDFPLALDNPYKLCDFKPAYGYIFESYISDYDFWGHCDIDMILGNLSKYLTDKILNEYDKLFCLGHMVLYRNTFENNRVFMTEYKGSDLYRKVFSDTKIQWFDEEWKNDSNINRIFLSQGKRVYQKDFSANFSILPTNFVRVFYRVDTDGRGGYEKDLCEDPLYYWDRGHVYRISKKNGELRKDEFIYMHLQKRKMSLNKRVLDLDGFKVVPNAFLPLQTYPVSFESYLKESKKTLCFHRLQLEYKWKMRRLKEVFAHRTVE